MAEIRSGFLGQCVRLAFGLTLAVVLAVASGFAQERPQVSLETSETLFTVLTAINTCGYDPELRTWSLRCARSTASTRRQKPRTTCLTMYRWRCIWRSRRLSRSK